MESVVQSLRHTLRRLGRSPAFTAAAVLSLGLGIGANTALFSLTNAIFLRGRGVVEPERVVQVFRNSGGPYWRVTWEDYRRMRDDLGGLFTHVTAFTEDGVRLGDSDDVVAALRVSGDYFGVMGVQPGQGRPFLPGEDTDVEAGPGVAILSHDLWQRAFGGAPDIVGREIRVNAQPTTVVGVLPEDFTAKATGIAMDVFVPDREFVTRRSSDNLWAAARLAPGVTLEQVRSGLARVAADYNQDRPESLRPVEFTVVSEADVRVHPGTDRAIGSMALLLFGVVSLVLLIACTNLASFLLARAEDRRKEFAVRRAMGASRGRIVGQLLGESMVLGVLGGALGLLLAYLSLDLLLGVQPPIPVEVNLDVSPDGRVLGFTLGISLLAGALFGMFPALQASRAPVAPTLRDESAGSTGTARRWTVRGGLVAAQVTFSLVLLIAAGLFLRSLLAATGISPGFEPEGVALTTVDPATTRRDAGTGAGMALRRGRHGDAGIPRGPGNRAAPRTAVRGDRRRLRAPGGDPEPDRGAHALGRRSRGPGPRGPAPDALVAGRGGAYRRSGGGREGALPGGAAEAHGLRAPGPAPRGEGAAGGQGDAGEREHGRPGPAAPGTGQGAGSGPVRPRCHDRPGIHGNGPLPAPHGGPAPGRVRCPRPGHVGHRALRGGELHGGAPGEGSGNPPVPRRQCRRHGAPHDGRRAEAGGGGPRAGDGAGRGGGTPPGALPLRRERHRSHDLPRGPGRPAGCGRARGVGAGPEGVEGLPTRAETPEATHRP